MAKRRKRAGTQAAPAVKIVRAAAPIVRVSAPRAATRRRRSSRRSQSRSSSMGGLVSNEAVQMAIGGALYGYAVKSGLIAKLPEIPVLGRTGTAALLLDYWSRHGGGTFVHRAARAAAVLAGYQLGNEGKISGDEDEMISSGDFAMGTDDDASTPGSMAGDDDGY